MRKSNISVDFKTYIHYNKGDLKKGATSHLLRGRKDRASEMVNETQLARLAPAERTLWREWLDTCEVLGVEPRHGAHLLTLAVKSQPHHNKKDPRPAR